MTRQPHRAKRETPTMTPALTYQLSLADQIDRMMTRMADAAERRDAEIEEERQQEHRIALRLQDGPVPSVVPSTSR